MQVGGTTYDMFMQGWENTHDMTYKIYTGLMDHHKINVGDDDTIIMLVSSIPPVF